MSIELAEITDKESLKVTASIYDSEMLMLRALYKQLKGKLPKDEPVGQSEHTTLKASAFSPRG